MLTSLTSTHQQAVFPRGERRLPPVEELIESVRHCLKNGENESGQSRDRAFWFTPGAVSVAAGSGLDRTVLSHYLTSRLFNI
jgi:hypothetical protein